MLVHAKYTYVYSNRQVINSGKSSRVYVAQEVKLPLTKKVASHFPGVVLLLCPWLRQFSNIACMNYFVVVFSGSVLAEMAATSPSVCPRLLKKH